MSRNVSKTVSGIFFCCLRSYLDRAHWFFRGAFSDQKGGGLLSTEVDKKGREKRRYLLQSGVAEHQLKRGCCRGINCGRGVAEHQLKRVLQGHQHCRDFAGEPTLQRCGNNCVGDDAEAMRLGCCRAPAASKMLHRGYQLCQECCM